MALALPTIGIEAFDAHTPLPDELTPKVVGLLLRAQLRDLASVGVDNRRAVVGYMLSRTVGLPSFREASWSQALEPMGVLSLIVEGLFVSVALPLIKDETGTNRTTPALS